MAEPGSPVDLVASFFTLAGSGFTDPPRHGFVQRCRAAADAGFTGIGLHAADLPRTVAGGLDVAGMRSVLADTGLRLVEIEFLGGWALDGPDEALVSGIEAVAAAFGGRHVSAGEFRSAPAGGLDLDAAAARLGALAARLQRSGLLVALEAFPWSAIPDIDTALELLRRAGAGNAGLMIDVWHFHHGATDAGVLAGRPPGTVAAVQLNDGPRVRSDFLRHARAGRRLPGEGELDVVGLVRAVRATGFAGPWCVEVNTPEHNALPVTEAARRAAGAALAVLDPGPPVVDEIPLRAGGRLLVRPIRESDAAALVALHARLSAGTVYRRYFGARPQLSAADVERFTRVPGDWRFALVAVREPDDLVAVARYEGTPGGAAAEIAIVVDDALQHQGVGRALFGRLAEVARGNGLTALVADVLGDNEPMRALLRSTGLPSRTARETGTLQVTLDLTALTLSDLAATRSRAHIAAARAGAAARNVG